MLFYERWLCIRSFSVSSTFDMKSRGIFVGSGMKYMSRHNATMTKGTLLCLWNMDFHSSLIYLPTFLPSFSFQIFLIKWHIVLGTKTIFSYCYVRVVYLYLYHATEDTAEQNTRKLRSMEICSVKPALVSGARFTLSDCN